MKAKLPLKLVVFWVDESGKELTPKRVQSVTAKWLTAENGFTEEIGERSVDVVLVVTQARVYVCITVALIACVCMCVVRVVGLQQPDAADDYGMLSGHHRSCCQQQCDAGFSIGFGDLCCFARCQCCIDGYNGG